MLSSSRPMSSCQQAANVSKESTANDKRYHRTVYDDGRRRYIVESQRAIGRSRAGGVDAKGPRRSQHCLVINGDEAVPSKHSTNQTSPNPSLSKKSSKPQRVALASSRDICHIVSPKLSKPGVAVALSLEQYAVTVEVDRRLKARSWEEPTPPPTPQLGRLPSPELSDLDEGPFCECDDAKVVPFCTLCKKEAHCPVVWR